MKAVPLITSIKAFLGRPFEFVTHNEHFFFFAKRIGEENSETYAFDGNNLTSLYTSAAFRSPQLFFPYDDTNLLIFEAKNVYITDGTTSEVYTDNSGVISQRFESDGPITFKDSVFYGSDCNQQNGTELCRLKDFETELVADLRLGPQDSSPRMFRILNEDLMWFKADIDPIDGFSNPLSLYDHDMFVTDGTSDGTVPLKSPNVNMYQNTVPLVLNGYLYFRGRSTATGCDHLWRTDGTVDGTMEVFAKEDTWTCSSFPDSFVPLDDNRMLFFALSDQLFVLDTRSMETKMLWSSTHENAGFGVREHVNLNGRILFTQQYRPDDGYIFVSDGTQEGTGVFVDVLPLGGKEPRHLVVANDRIYFLTSDTDDTGVSLWETDGMDPASTKLVDIDWQENGGVSALSDHKRSTSLYTLKGDIFFRTERPNGTGDIWRLTPASSNSGSDPVSTDPPSAAPMSSPTAAPVPTPSPIAVSAQAPSRLPSDLPTLSPTIKPPTSTNDTSTATPSQIDSNATVVIPTLSPSSQPVEAEPTASNLTTGLPPSASSSESPVKSTSFGATKEPTVNTSSSGRVYTAAFLFVLFLCFV